MNRVAAKTGRGSQQRRLVITRRKTYQRGSVSEKPKKSKNFSLRYRELDHKTGKWAVRRVALGKFDNISAARLAAEPIMAQVNERNNTEPRKLDTNLTFEEFIKTR